MKDICLKAYSLHSFQLDKPLTLKAGDSIYFMGIGGTGMSSLAVYLKQQAFKVSGSDHKNFYPPTSLVLKNADIPVFKYHADNIKKSFKMIVVGKTIRPNHVEIQKAKDLDIPVLSLPEFLQQSLLSNTTNIVITGTNGKSTSTALMAYTAKQAGQNPGFFYGAVSYDFQNSFHSNFFQTEALKEGALKTNTKKSDYFVIEGDEYDTSFFVKRAKFFYYKPSYVMLTGIEFDHGDTYKNLDEIQQVFSKFVSEIPSHGILVACIENETVKKTLPFCKASVLTYGIGQGDFQITSRKMIPSYGSNKNNMPSQGTFTKLQQIELTGPDKKTYQLLTPLLGWHNALNTVGVFVLAKQLQWKEDQILQALKTFKGLKRRLEFRFEYKGVQIYEDFACHPTAVQAGLSTLKEIYPQKRLLVLFDHRFFIARFGFFQKDYVSSFKPADLIFIPKFGQTYKQEKSLSVKTLIEDLKKEGKEVFYSESIQQLEEEFKKQIKKEDLAVFMSCGAAFVSILEHLNPYS